MQTQIIPKYVNPPKPGGKMGSIKDQQDGFYLVPPAYLGHFQIGQPVNVEFNEKPGQQGGTIRFISSINGLSITGQQGPVQRSDTPAPIPQNVPKQEATPPLLSNVLAHAIEHGLIKHPEQMSEWASWVKEAEKAYHAGAGREQDHGLQNNPVSGEQGFHQGPDDTIPY